MTAKINPIL
jgi:hypothetical protein